MIDKFVDTVKDKTWDEIYEYIEDDTDESARIRDMLYEIADRDTPEPIRSAMIKLGNIYNVAVLINW